MKQLTKEQWEQDKTREILLGYLAEMRDESRTILDILREQDMKRGGDN